MTLGEALKILVAPVVVAVVSLLAAWWKETAQRRSAEQVRQRLVVYVKDEIGVIDAWMKAHAALDPSNTPPAAVRERARHDLDVAYDRMVQLVPENRRPITLQSLVTRLLLRHVPASRAVLRRRQLYYFTLVLTIVWAFFGFTPPNAWATANDAAVTLMVYFLLAVVPAWLAARSVLTAARDRESGNEQDRPAVGSRTASV
jgi:hypothetical protein